MESQQFRTIIKPRTGWIGINIKELWHYRELFVILVWRDIKVRYKQTVIGIAWAILQPFLLMVVFSIFFGSLANIDSGTTPYPIFVYSGLLFWTYFSTSLTNSSNSLIENENLLKKVYFPRLILPFTPTLTPLVDFLLSLIVFLGIALYYNFSLSILHILVVIPLILISFMTAAGLGSFLAAINVQYRDIRYALPFFIQTLLFVTPVIYPVSLIPEQYQWVLALNPLTGVIETARAIILQDRPLDITLLLVSTIIAIVLLLVGVFYFRRIEKKFADIA